MSHTSQSWKETLGKVPILGRIFSVEINPQEINQVILQKVANLVTFLSDKVVLPTLQKIGVLKRLEDKVISVARTTGKMKEILEEIRQPKVFLLFE